MKANYGSWEVYEKGCRLRQPFFVICFTQL